LTDLLLMHSIQHGFETCPPGYFFDTPYGHLCNEVESAFFGSELPPQKQASGATVQLMPGTGCGFAASSGPIRAAPDQVSKRFLAIQTLDKARRGETFVQRWFGLGANGASLSTRLVGGLALVIGLATTVPLPSSAVDEARGKQLFVVCSACHGPNGGGNTLAQVPSIAGLDEWYLVRQLNKFREGKRGAHFDDPGGGRMRAMAQTIDSEDSVRELAAYIAYLPPVKPSPVLSGGDSQRGANLFVACVACHGLNGDGNRNLALPAINHQADWYLLTQLKHFKAGIRGAAPGDKSGASMRAIAGTLPNEQAMLDVVAYITTLSPGRGASYGN
jgi:cytochrome c553